MRGTDPDDRVLPRAGQLVAVQAQGDHRVVGDDEVFLQPGVGSEVIPGRVFLRRTFPNRVAADRQRHPTVRVVVCVQTRNRHRRHEGDSRAEKKLFHVLQLLSDTSVGKSKQDKDSDNRERCNSSKASMQ